MAKSPFAKFFNLLIVGTILAGGFIFYEFYYKNVLENKALKAMVERLQADSRIAEVAVTNVEFNPLTNQHMTTIKFLEFDALGQPLEPRYFTFSGNIIQFQSLVVRFDEKFVRNADALKGKSAYLFWKVFMLDGERTQEYPVTNINEVPRGYKIEGPRNFFEEEIWRNFWQYALDPDRAKLKGIKNAQIEAPGTQFVPGLIYTLKIEHDGGIRIDVNKIPDVLKGEKVL